MARNRKNQATVIQFGPVLKASFLCLVIGGSAIGYVWQKSQIDRLGTQISVREKRLNELQADNKRLRDQLSILHSPVMLDRRTKELNLGLVPASPSQVVRLEEPAPRWVENPQHNLSREFTQRSMNRAMP